MSNKRFILEYGKDLIVGGVLLAYIFSELKTPELLQDGANNMMGLVAIGMIVLVSFSLFHPIVGFLAIVLVFKIVANEGKIKQQKMPELVNYSNNLDNDLNNQIVVSSQKTPIVVRSNDTTLEQEVISRMAPLSAQSYSNNDNTVQPVMTNLSGVSPIE